MTENKGLQQKLVDERDAFAAAAAAASAAHCMEATVLRREITELRMSFFAAQAAETIVASLTDENMALADATRALKTRVAELEELVDMSRMYLFLIAFIVVLL